MNRIPKMIHQVWSGIDEPLPRHFEILGESWKNDYPEWEYIVWDNQKMNDFIQLYYPEYWDIYQAYPYNVQRWDVIRYLILYRMGGMYVDFDYQSLERMDNLLADKECCFSEEEFYIDGHGNRISVFNNALMLSIPGHPFMKKIIDEVFTEGVLKYPAIPRSTCVLETTGPGMLCRLYKNATPADRDSIYLIPSCYVSPFSVKQAGMVRRGYRGAEVEAALENAYAVHYFWGGWL